MENEQPTACLSATRTFKSDVQVPNAVCHLTGSVTVHLIAQVSVGGSQTSRLRKIEEEMCKTNEKKEKEEKNLIYSDFFSFFEFAAELKELKTCTFPFYTSDAIFFIYNILFFHLNI